MKFKARETIIEGKNSVGPRERNERKEEGNEEVEAIGNKNLRNKEATQGKKVKQKLSTRDYK